MNVKLCNRRKASNFLRTLRNPSEFKDSFFFDRAVQTLDISSDVEPECVLEILNSCRSVTSLTYWGPPPSHPFPPLKTHNIPGALVMGGGGHLRWSRAAPGQSQWPLPERLSISLREDRLVPFHPHLSGPYFLSVTHLSLGNRWENWSAWLEDIDGSLLISLQYLKLEISGGVHGPEEQCSRNPKAMCVDNATGVAPSQAGRIAGTVDNILQRCLALKVLILQMRCDATPTQSACIIARAQDHFDPRVVFAWEKQPFRFLAAHDEQQLRLWRSAEVLVRGQGRMGSKLFVIQPKALVDQLAGYAVLDCDGLI